MTPDASADVGATLRAAAFGDRPGLHPLPPAPTGASLWHRAVALGGQGRHAAAAAALDRLTGPAAEPVLASLATSTRASLLRQLGGHGAARVLDGRALALVAGRPGAGAAAARADALTGLAADALGGRTPHVSRRLLAAAAGAVADLAGDATVGPDGLAAADVAAARRPEVRLGWVRAESALRLDEPAGALEAARAAAALAETGGSVRHRVKSGLVLAAALAAGDPDGAVASATASASAAADHGLLPLAWAASLLLQALRPPGRTRCGGAPGPVVSVVTTDCAWIITYRGGLLPATRRTGRGTGSGPRGSDGADGSGP